MSEYKAVKITGGAIADLEGKKKRKQKMKGDMDEPLIEVHSFKNAIITKMNGGSTMIAPVTTSVVAPSLLSLQNNINYKNNISHEKLNDMKNIFISLYNMSNNIN